jgi:signal transduction histidine kinase
MLNSGDQFLVNLFLLILPGAIFLLTVVLISYFYFRRFKRLIGRYRMQKMEEVENERKRIANDLHDFVGSKLLIIKSELHESLQASQNPKEHSTIAQGISDLNKFHDELRYLVEYIYPKELMTNNIEEGIRRLAEDMSNTHTKIMLDIEFENVLSQNSVHQLYRLLQEKISNIIAHQKPPNIFISLCDNKEDDEVMLSLSYKTNNIPIHSRGKSGKRMMGRGLSIIQERLKVLRARVHEEYTDGFYKEFIVFPIHKNK